MSLALLLLIPPCLWLSNFVDSMDESQCEPVHVASGSIMDIRVKHALIPLSNIVYGKIICAGQMHHFSPARLPSLYCPTASETIEEYVHDLCEPLPPINDTIVAWFRDRGYKSHLRQARPFASIQNQPNRH